MDKLGAMPQNRDVTVNKEMHSRKSRLRPNVVASHPVMGSTIAFDTRYEVRTHVLSSLLAPRSPAKWGKATFAMLVSSTSMNAAIATTIAISQGLNFGLHSSPPSAIVPPTGRRPSGPPTCPGGGGGRRSDPRPD